MKKKLTINTLAIGNLKARKKQYIIMIIGIILAMVFSSSIVLFAFSAKETSKEISRTRYGAQSGLVTSEKLDRDDYQRAIDDGYISKCTFMHEIGYGYTDENSKKLGASVAWFEDDAWELYHLKMLEGEYPQSENEVAVESNALKRLGYKEAKLGDTITLKIMVQDGNSYGKTVEKEYKLSGIVSDRKNELENRDLADDDDNYEKLIPAIYVAKNTPVETGGRERLVGIYLSEYLKEYINPNDKTDVYDKYTAPYGYLGNMTGNVDEVDVEPCGCYFTYNSFSLGTILDNGEYLSIIIIALVFASCVAIVNAFNTNLKERKKQIGLFRAVGTTKRQIINIFGREAFIISLIATPVSTALSYGIVKLILSIFSEDATMSKSIWALVVSAVVNVIVVMLAALIPLFIASRTTPMQAIRDVDVNRKAKVKKVKSKKQFSVASHIAKRNTKFYKGSLITVSIMLTITICFSCLAFSMVEYEKTQEVRYPYDYMLEMGYWTDDIRQGISEKDKQYIESLPYVDRIYCKKNVDCKIEVDELDNFARVMDYNEFEYKNDYEMLKTFEELCENMNAPANKRYLEKKNQLGISKEMLGAKVEGCDDYLISKLENTKVEGKIDIEKLKTGEEIILICPEKAELTGFVYNNGSGMDTLFDENIGKSNPRYSSIMTGESNYKVGDEISFVVPKQEYNEKDDTYSYSVYAKNTVKIGAIIRPNDLNRDCYNDGFYSNNVTLVTNIQGLDKLVQGINYSSVSFDVFTELNDEEDAKINDDLSLIAEKYQTWLFSKYSQQSYVEKSQQSLYTAIITLVIIGFVICISIINNSITAQIRENKRVIGTLRAVGADRGDLIKSYVLQMLSMFGWGTGLGYGLFALVMLIAKIYSLKVYDATFSFKLDPWITIAMTVVSFVACFINIWSKIRKEANNSIIENIREL